MTVNDCQATVKRLLNKIADSSKSRVLPLKSQYGVCSSSRVVGSVDCKRFFTVVKQGRPRTTCARACMCTNQNVNSRTVMVKREAL